MRTLSETRKADRATMVARVAALACKHGITAVRRLEEPGTRFTSVDLAGPHGLKLTVRFDGGSWQPGVYVLSWYGIEDSTRLRPGVFWDVNAFHGCKATDIACGFAQLETMLGERFAAIADGSAFVSETGAK